MSVRILVVDDEPAILLAYKKLLGGPHVEVDTAECFEEALGFLDRYDYRAAVVDLRIGPRPVEEGLEFIRYLRKERPGTAVVVATAYGNAVIKEAAHGLGAAFYFEKPVPIKRLKEALKAEGVY